MPETLLSATSIKMYGRKVGDLVLSPRDPGGGLGDNRFLRKQLAKEAACFARIYAFTYEGNYYELPRPCIFLVHGDGEPVSGDSVDATGVAGHDWSLSTDVRMWEYDKGDFSLRLEVDSGPLEQILLEATIHAQNLQSHYSGKMAMSHRGGKLIE